MTGKKVLSDKDIKQIETMSGLGMPVEQIAHVLHMSKATFDRRQQENPEIAEALSKGRALASKGVRETAYQMATSGKHPALTIFWLKTREGWKEPKDVDEESIFRDMALADLIKLVREKLPEMEKK